MDHGKHRKHGNLLFEAESFGTTLASVFSVFSVANSSSLGGNR